MIDKMALETSFRYRLKIQKVFKEILGLHEIDHFSLDLVTPDEKMIFFSGTPSHAYEICNRGYGEYDGIISPENYHNYEFYWWANASHKKYRKQIENIRSGLFGLRNGFMLVRNIDDFYLVYSFATKSKNPLFQTNIINTLNDLLKIGDWVYEEMRSDYQNYTGVYIPPKIGIFKPFKGGKPEAIYTKDYYEGCASKKNNIVLLHDYRNL